MILKFLAKINFSNINIETVNQSKINILNLSCINKYISQYLNAIFSLKFELVILNAYEILNKYTINFLQKYHNQINSFTFLNLLFVLSEHLCNNVVLLLSTAITHHSLFA